MTIQDWPADERPRERWLARGPAALSDAELLALFLRVGIRGRSAVDVAHGCIERFGGLAPIFAAELGTVASLPGIGMTRAIQLRAVIELSRRAIHEQLRLRPLFDSPQAVRDYLRLMLGQLGAETFVALFLDAQHRLIVYEELFRGSLTQTAVYPREILKRALGLNAAAIVFAHNHPSGIAEPSQADRTLTDVLRRALELIDVRVLDHFVVGGPQVVSFAERGWL
ncbi:DNA repair protein RadC [soil metagenome]